MKKIIILLILIPLHTMLAQDFFPRFLRQNIHGQVVLEIPFMNEFMEFKNYKRHDSAAHFEVTCYSVNDTGGVYTYWRDPNFGDTYMEDTDAENALKMRNFPANLYGSPDTEQIDSNTIRVFEKYGEEKHSYTLKYNNLGKLKTINEVFNYEGEENRTPSTCKWQYLYKNNKIKTIITIPNDSLYNYDSKGDLIRKKLPTSMISTVFEYNAQGQLISEICYKGKINIPSPYLCSDSLLSLHKRLSYPYAINKVLDKKDFKILQLTFYTYTKGNLTRIVFFDQEQYIGVKKIEIKYDSLKRISAVLEENKELNYLYDQKNRVIEKIKVYRNEHYTGDYGGTETHSRYYYNDMGLLMRIDYEPKPRLDPVSKKFTYR